MSGCEDLVCAKADIAAVGADLPHLDVGMVRNSK